MDREQKPRNKDIPPLSYPFSFLPKDVTNAWRDELKKQLPNDLKPEDFVDLVCFWANYSNFPLHKISLLMTFLICQMFDPLLLQNYLVNMKSNFWLTFVIQVFALDYGMKDKNPVDNMHFYSKENPDMAVMLPKEKVRTKAFMTEYFILVFPCMSCLCPVCRYSWGSFWYDDIHNLMLLLFLRCPNFCQQTFLRRQPGFTARRLTKQV